VPHPRRVVLLTSPSTGIIDYIGNVADLTPEARADGRELMERLQTLLDLIDNMTHEGSSLLQPPGVTSAVPNPAVSGLAKQVMQMCREIQYKR